MFLILKFRGVQNEYLTWGLGANIIFSLEGNKIKIRKDSYAPIPPSLNKNLMRGIRVFSYLNFISSSENIIIALWAQVGYYFCTSLKFRITNAAWESNLALYYWQKFTEHKQEFDGSNVAHIYYKKGSNLAFPSILTGLAIKFDNIMPLLNHWTTVLF